MKKVTMRTLLAAGFVMVSLLSTGLPTSAATDTPADRPDDPITESFRRDLKDSDAPVDAEQPAEELKDVATERYRRVLEELQRLPAVEDLQDDSASQPERQ